MDVILKIRSCFYEFYKKNERVKYVVMDKKTRKMIFDSCDKSINLYGDKNMLFLFGAKIVVNGSKTLFCKIIGEFGSYRFVDLTD